MKTKFWGLFNSVSSNRNSSKKRKHYVSTKSITLVDSFRNPSYFLPLSFRVEYIYKEKCDFLLNSEPRYNQMVMFDIYAVFSEIFQKVDCKHLIDIFVHKIIYKPPLTYLTKSVLVIVMNPYFYRG